MRDIGQHLRALSIVTEDTGSIPRNHLVANPSPLTPAARDLMPLLASVGKTSKYIA